MRIVAGVLLLAACSGPSPAPSDNGNAIAPSPAASQMPRATPSITAAPDETRYLGRWIGVEGMYLAVTRRPQGGVMLEMQYDLDHKGSFPGSVTAEGLRFVRDGKDEIAVPSDGDATGLKYLAGKRDCLTVRAGEGYCRAS